MWSNRVLSSLFASTNYQRWLCNVYLVMEAWEFSAAEWALILPSGGEWYYSMATIP